ncbi:MAG: methyl-accepting chemotaxis protein [Myxococcota bacterium]
MARRPWNLVHPFQRKYAAWIAALLFSYSVIVFGLAVIAPYVLPAVKLASAMPLDIRRAAAEQFLFLAETLWPAVFGLILGSIVFTIYLTNRLAGPLYRLDEYVRSLASGDLSQRVRLRKGDELHDLAQLTNQCIDRFEDTLLEVQMRAGQAGEALHAVLVELNAQERPNPAWVSHLEAALKESRGLEEIVSRFQLSEPR